MADEEDLAALHGGSSDLVRRDFRGADLGGLSLSDRDFSHAHLERANFAKADLSNGVFSQANAAMLNVEHANLSTSRWIGGSVYAVNFQGADLRNSLFSRCLFSKCNFRDADLRGASFANSTIQDGTNFDGALVDEATDFDGVNILRPLARQDAFRYYEVERGALRRIQRRDDREPVDLRAASRTELISKIDALLADLRRLEPPVADDPSTPKMGHNNPPEEMPLDRSEHTSLTQALVEIRAEATTNSPDTAKAGVASGVLVTFGAKILRWLGGHANTAADEFAKGLGKNMSDPLKLAAAWTLVAGGLTAVAQMARALFGLP